jgi:N-acyl homoserine lactone hydrolase
VFPIERLTLAVVTAVPEWHPEHATFEPFPVHAWVVRHPDGALLVDTGIGLGNSFIDEMYRPSVTPLADALGSVGLALSDIMAVVLSHLHFDHCGQQDLFDSPVYVQVAEYEAAKTPGYTVPEWAAIPEHRLRLVDGDAQIAVGLRAIATPGHTPGHQSVLIETEGERVLLAAQCAFHADEIRRGEPVASNLHDDGARERARASLLRVRSFAPVTVELSHDTEVVVIEK